jgi:hypothetical protein|tara:strand:+ start:2615 stop:3064 length:450 start_codon:yes stop_codon:yes gene_type:complete
MITPSSINQLLGAVGNSIHKHGVEGTIRALENFEDEPQYDFSIEFKIVVESVTKEFNIREHDLIFGNSKKGGVRTAALECSAFVLSECFEIDRKLISQRLNKHISIISRYITAAKNYDPNHPFDKNKFESLQRIINVVQSNWNLINTQT